MYRLKCEYYEGMFSNEYAIKINSAQNSFFVNKKDVTHLDKTQGLVKIVLLSLKGDKALVGINDVGDCRESRFYVPKKDLLTV